MIAARDYFDHLSQITADIVTATVESRNADNSYMVRSIGRQSLIRATTANPLDEFAVGSRVRVQIPTASRNEHGSNGVIVSRAPREQRGLSGSTPAEQDDAITAAAIIHVDPDPLILVQGGNPDVQIITGVGFTAAATYHGQLDGDDPDLTDDDAPVITTSKVTMSIQATMESALGLFDIVISGARAKDALRIVPNTAPVDITLSNNQIAENQPIGTVFGILAAIDQDAGDSHTFALVSGDGDDDNPLFAIDGNDIRTAAVLDYEASATRNVRVRATDAAGLSVEKAFVISVTDIEVEYGYFVVGKGASATELTLLIDYTGIADASSGDLGGTILRFIQLDDTNYLVFFEGSGARVVTVDPSDASFSLGPMGSHPEPWSVRAQFAIVGDSIYYGDSLNRLVQVNIADGTVENVVMSASTTPWTGVSYHSGTDSILTCNATLDGTVYRVRKIDRVTLNQTGSSAFSSGFGAPRLIATDGGTYWWVWISTEPGSGTVTTRVRRLYAASMTGEGSDGTLSTNANWHNAEMFMRDGQLFATHRTAANIGSRFVLCHHTPLSSLSTFNTSQYPGGVDTSQIRGLGIVPNVPADQGQYGVDLLWRLVGRGDGLANLMLIGHRVPHSAIAPFSTAFASINVTGLPNTYSEYGLGWTPV